MKIFSFDFLDGLSETERNFYLFLIKRISEHQPENHFYEVSVSDLPEILREHLFDKKSLISIVNNLLTTDVRWSVEVRGNEVIYDASLIGSWQVSSGFEGDLTLRYTVPELLITAIFEDKFSEELQSHLNAIQPSG
ncbi:MAG: hypothetical protein JXB48_22815 [Candidatus Latescibacteria bacterium]|nr:hypothetical protein [Candidatus Latescibacterota bacterium]